MERFVSKKRISQINLLGVLFSATFLFGGDAVGSNPVNLPNGAQVINGDLTFNFKTTAPSTLRPPRMTTTTRANLTGSEGMSIYNLNAHLLEWFDGTAWRDTMSLDGTQTPTNKNINCANNNCTFIPLSAFTNLGSTTTVLHGNASGSPTFGAVNLSSDVSNTLPIANGGTNNGSLAVTAGGTIYTDGSKLVNTGVGVTGQVLTSNGSGVPAWKPAGGTGSGINILQSFNWNAELGATTNWTNSGGTFAVDSTVANVANGTYAFTFTASASGQTVLSNLTAIPAGLYGQNCLLEFYQKGFDANMTVQVTDGTNVLLSRVLTAASLYTLQDMNFICPSSGSLQMKLVSTAASAQGWFDEVHLGSADNLAQVSQASLVGQIKITGCAGSWTTTSTTFADFGVQTGCVYTVLNGSGISAPSTMLPGLTFSSLAPGNYSLVYEGQVEQSVGGKDSWFVFTDGTTAANENSYITSNSTFVAIPGIRQTISYSTPQTNVTLKIQAKNQSGGTAELTGTTASPGVISVYRFPLASQLAINPNLGPSSWSGFHDSTCSWSISTTTSFVDFPGDSTCVFGQNGNMNFGSVVSATSSGNNIPGIVFTPNRTGHYWICANTFATTTAGSRLRLTDGTLTLATSTYSSSNNNSMLCSIYNAISTAAITLKIQAVMISAGSITAGGTSSAPAVNSVDWSIFAMDQSFPTPAYVGNVQSSTAGQLSLEYVSFGASTEPTACTASPCTMYRHSAAVTSVTRTGTGNYSINFAAGTWSAPPVCVGLQGAFSLSEWMGRTGTPTTSAYTVQTILSTGGGTPGDAWGDIICTGPH